MGTVGLSFGSPTSGTGFNVSSTVSTIVANLQNVEAPWKSQLTSLQSQNTVISSLGTLFSNLSTDLSSLTDFNGILSQKTGSSSDTNVLELTSATSSASAGTHTVQVTSLAQTSSGYLSAITNSSDTLSGSITLQVGSGTATTITLGSTNNTLAGLAKAINNAGAGVTASVLTDANGSRLSLVSQTSGAAGNITVSANSIADASNSNAALGYTSSVTGANAQLTVDGVSLTSASNTVSNLIPGLTFQLLAPTTTGQQVQVVIGNDNSGVESSLSQMVSDYNSLVSAMNQQQGNDSSGNAEPLFGSPTITLLQQQLLGALNNSSPNGYLDSVASASDVLTGSLSIQVGTGTAQTVTIPSGGETLSALATQVNNAGLGVTASVENLTGGGQQLVFKSGSAGSAGALTVTSSITDSTSGTSLAYNSEGTDINSLTSLGISVANDGTLSLDGTSLSSVLDTDFSSVAGFFQGVSSWGQNFSTMLDNAGTSSTNGTLALASKSNSSIESTLNADISKEDLLISAQQKSLTAELNSANEILQQLPSQLQGINEIYSAITGYGTSAG